MFNILVLGISFKANSKCNFNCDKLKVTFPKYFYGENVGKKECLRATSSHRFELKPLESSIDLISSVIGFDWKTNIKKLAHHYQSNMKKFPIQ